MSTATLEHTKPTKKIKATETRERLLVTPEIAKAWLDVNKNNRKIIANHVEKLARDMRSGEWDYTGEAIKFDWNNNLIDGQHRLLACIKAERPFETLVVYNLPPETQKKMDGGRPRKASDIISMGGLHYASNIAAASRLILAEKYGDKVRKGTYTTTELIDALGRHPQLAASVRQVRSGRCPRGISPSHIATIHYIAARILKVEVLADEFVNVIVTGVPSYDGDAAHAYRERLMNKGSTKGKDPTSDAWRLIKHAWNLFALGKPAKLMRGSLDVSIDGLDLKDL